MVIAFIVAALKIIGIALLVVLTLLLTALAVIMLVPVKYELYGERYEAVRLKAAAVWLFGLLDIRVEYGTDGKTVKVSFAGHKIYPGDKKSRGVKERGSEQEKKADSEPQQDKAEVRKKPEVRAMDKKNEPKPQVKKGSIKPQVVRIKMTEQLPESTEEEELVTKLRFCTDYIKAMPGEDKITALKALIKFLKGIVKHVMPYEFRLYAVVGTDDPAQTGYILAAAGIARGVTGKDIVVQGDFENEKLEGEVSARGRIRLGSLAVLVIKLVFTKPIRKFIIRFLKVRGELV